MTAPVSRQKNGHEFFEPFVRLDPSRDRATGGCGLGLAIVHSIALAYQGSISVNTSPLGGASFRFSWPIKHICLYPLIRINARTELILRELTISCTYYFVHLLFREPLWSDL